MLLKTIRITKEQDKLLKKTAKKLKVSESEVVRRQINNL